MELHKYRDVDRRGTIRRVHYETLDFEGKKWVKYANVYLPYGYDEEKPYNILYLMHGGGGNPDAWLDTCQIKNALDRGFDEQLAEPFIAVFPTYYSLIPSEHRAEGIDASWENDQIRAFQREFREDLVPAVEGRFHTYAQDTTPEGLKKSREHRAFGGFSMGGGTTWYVFLDNLDIVSRFLPLSGDCWIVQPMGGRLVPEETAAIIARMTREKGYGKDDYQIFAGTGDQDIGLDNLRPMLKALEAYPDLFVFNEDPAVGNIRLTIKENAPHTYEDVYHHVWNYIPNIF